jgi:Tfp pilus assembly protein PilN
MREQLRPVLTKLSRKRATGLLIDEERITVSRLVQTAFGPVERERHVEEIGRDTLEAALKRALSPVFERREWKVAPIAVGLPELRFLFASRSLGPMNRDVSGETLLHESMQLTNILIDDLAVDTLRTTNSRGGTATIVAARKRYLEPLLEALQAAGVRPHTVEPRIFGLLRVAVDQHPAPRRNRPVYRVFLGRQAAMVVPTAGPRPLSWRGLPLPPGGEAAALVAAIGTMRALALRHGDEPPSTVLLHGRPELAPALTADAHWAEWELEVIAHEGPGLDDGIAAFGIGAGCHQEDEGFNLARSLRPQRSFVSVFPWGQAAVQAGVLAATAGLMGGQLYDLKTQVNVAKLQAQRHEWMGKMKVADLKKETDDLNKRAELIARYLGTRFQWANYVREVASRLPTSMGISAFEGKATFAPPGGKASSVQSLTLQVEAPLPPGATVPADINALMENLRTTPLLKRTLPLITMSELKWNAARNRAGTTASFSLLCTPPASAAKGAKKKAGGGGMGKG